jgi:hypothetical protein
MLGCVLQLGGDRCALSTTGFHEACRACVPAAVQCRPPAAPQRPEGEREETGIEMEKDPRMAILRNPIGPPFHLLAARLGR